MQNFRFYSPTEVVFGKGTEMKTAAEVVKYGGSRVFVVYGGGSVKRSGLLERIENSLAAAGIAYEEFGGVKPNPLLSHAELGVKKAVAFKADFILAVGGGSAIDTAKGIAHGTANQDIPLWDIWTGQKEIKSSLPLGVVLTISAAGSETSDSAVLTNEDIGAKKGLGTELNRPKFAIMNPELTYTLPKYQLTCGIVDIMMHTLDRYFTPTEGNELTDEFAEALLRTTIKNGEIACRNQYDYDAMSELMWCGSISHNDLTGLGAEKDFSPHKLGHELSAKYDVAHGASLSAVWGAWSTYVYKMKPERFRRYLEKVWGEKESDVEKAAKRAIEKTVAYFTSLGMPVSLPGLQVGAISDEELQDMAQRATGNDSITVGSFCPLKYQDAYEIYKLANK